jgi:hypothetical protein
MCDNDYKRSQQLADLKASYLRCATAELEKECAVRRLAPSAIYCPDLKVTLNGNEIHTWRMVYGDCVGVGSSPESAARDFDKKWSIKTS